MTRRTESVIIPNALLAFTLMAGMFGCILVALDFELIRFFQARSTIPWSFWAWIGLPWLAVMHGAVWAAWGTFYARPSALSSGLFSSVLPEHYRIARFLRKSIVANACCVGSPFAVDIIILVPTVIANSKYNLVLARYEAWQRQWSSAQSLSHDMIVEAQMIWYDLIVSSHRISITFALWSVIAFILWLCYTSVAWQLLRTIRKQIVDLENKAPQPTPEILITAPPMNSNSSVVSCSPNLDEKPCLPSQDGQHRRDIEVGLFTRDQMAEDEPVSADRMRTCQNSVSNIDADRRFGSQTETFFPAVRPSKLVRKQITSQQATRKTQASYLRRVWWNVFVQSAAISAAIMAFFGVAMYAACRIYDAYEVNELGECKIIGPFSFSSPRREKQKKTYVVALVISGPAFSIALLWACWTSVFFGFVVLAAIAGRVYEPVSFGVEKGSTGSKKRNSLRPAFKLSHRLGAFGSPPPAALDQIQVQTSFFETESVVPQQRRSGPSQGTPAVLTVPSPSLLKAKSPAGSSFKMPDVHRSSTSSRATSVDVFEDAREYDGEGGQDVVTNPQQPFVTDLSGNFPRSPSLASTQAESSNLAHGSSAKAPTRKGTRQQPPNIDAIELAETRQRDAHPIPPHRQPKASSRKTAGRPMR